MKDSISCLGLPEFTFADKVVNRVKRIYNWHNLPLIPLEKGEALLIWFLAIVLFSGWVIGLTGISIFLGWAFAYVFVAIVGGIFLVITGAISWIAGLFRH